ncbi:MAG TPA: homoserine transporter [Cytophagales bacterium]|nr:homoserine transporter [Cytophagales bacterium]HAA20330.1 homoserine transporter [Cytophagales bacterium]HAP62903.1 homoserine transporter [Cytophagales bacterium]
MIEAFWNGILGGLFLAILIGPVFFALMQTAVEKGFFHGIFLALGIMLSDAFYFFLCWLGISSFEENDTVKAYMALAGGVILVGFGIVYIVKPVARKGVKQRDVGSRTRLASEILKGFLLNGVNPGVLFFWIGIVSAVTANPRYGNSEGAFMFALGILLTVFTTDILKAYLANKLSALVTPQFMKIMNRVVGLALFGFGLYMFYTAFETGIWNLNG